MTELEVAVQGLEGLVTEGVISSEVADQVQAQASDFYLGAEQVAYIERAVAKFEERAKVERLRKQPIGAGV